MPSLTPPLSLSTTCGALLGAGVVGGIAGGVGLYFLISDLLHAPEGYEDDTGFHVIRKNANGEEKEARKS